MSSAGGGPGEQVGPHTSALKMAPLSGDRVQGGDGTRRGVPDQSPDAHDNRSEVHFWSICGNITSLIIWSFKAQKSSTAGSKGDRTGTASDRIPYDKVRTPRG